MNVIAILLISVRLSQQTSNDKDIMIMS